VDIAYFTDPAETATVHGRVARAVELAIGRVLSKRHLRAG
jgi:hypothetical protein